MDVVLRTLLARLVTLGMCIKLLLLDQGFYSVRGIQDLMTCGLPFIMPAVKRGKKPTTAGDPLGRMPWQKRNTSNRPPIP